MKRLLALACAVSMYAVPAGAADLGKDGGITDLEERVAELEATAAKKGNRKVTVVVTGQINKAMLWASEELGSKQHGVIDNSTSPSFVSVEGLAKINKDWKAGYRLELGVDSAPPIPLVQNQVSIRHNYLWLEGPIGKVSLGHTSMATDKITQITVANTEVASRMLSLAPLSTAYFLGFDLPWNNLRRDVVRYDSPMMGGLMISASYANGDSAFSSLLNSGFNPDHAWDVAVRYIVELKEGGGWRLAAGVGYRDENFVVNASPISFLPFVRDRVWSGSASVMHVGTGLFLSGSMARVNGELLFGGLDYDAYELQGGIERKIFAIGATTLFAEWAQLRVDSASEKPWFVGVGAVQAIDAAALDLYATYRQIDLDDGSPKASTVMVGARIRF